MTEEKTEQIKQALEILKSSPIQGEILVSDDLRRLLQHPTGFYKFEEGSQREGASVSRRDLILATVQDLVIDFVEYDRREDEELSTDDLVEAIDKGEITIAEISKAFKKALREHLNQY